MCQVPFWKCTTTAVFGIAKNDKYLDVRCIEQLPSTLEDPVDVKFHVVTPNLYENVYDYFRGRRPVYNYRCRRRRVNVYPHHVFDQVR